MLSDQIFYFVIVIGVLVTVHEFGHFIAARLCGMRTDVFSIGFGMRLFGFNKRSGFTFLDTPPNVVTFEIETDRFAPASKTIFQDPVRGEIDRIVNEHAADRGWNVLEITVEAVEAKPKKAGALTAAGTSDLSDLSQITVTYAASVKPGLLKPAGEELRIALATLLHAQGVTARVNPPTLGFEGAGMCDYRLALLPLGGYVKIAGMVDESMDTGFTRRAAQPWEFRAHPTWQRIIVISGGVAMNAVLAVALFIGLRYHGLPADLALPADPAATNGESFALNMGVYPLPTRAMVGELLQGSPAALAGVQSKDTILRVDTVPVFTAASLISMIRSHSGRPMTFEVAREDGRHQIEVTPNDSGKVGIAIVTLVATDSLPTYTFTRAITAGVADAAYNFSQLGDLLGKLFTGRASVKDNLGGPIAIMKMAGHTAERGLGYLLLLMATLSVSLAGLNILPVPALDGGHLVFIVIEGIIRREVPPKVKIVFQQVGFALLLLLMFFVVFNDLRR